MASQVSKALGAFLLSISEQVKNIGKPKQRMPAQYELKSCIQLIWIISTYYPISRTQFK